MISGSSKLGICVSVCFCFAIGTDQAANYLNHLFLMDSSNMHNINACVWIHYKCTTDGDAQFFVIRYCLTLQLQLFSVDLFIRKLSYNHLIALISEAVWLTGILLRRNVYSHLIRVIFMSFLCSSVFLLY